MGIRDLLQENVEVIAEALPEGTTFADWYADGCEFSDLIIGDDTHREAVAFAFGYLRGAHEMADLTLLELLEAEGVRMTMTSGTSRSIPDPHVCAVCGLPGHHTPEDGWQHDRCGDLGHEFQLAFSKAKGPKKAKRVRPNRSR